MSKTFATEEDFLFKRKFCAFRISLDMNDSIVEDAGVAEIQKDDRNGELRLYWLGAISYAPIKELRLQSASALSYTGYYVDYEDNYAEARRAALKLANERKQEMANAMIEQLRKFVHNDMIFIRAASR